MRTTVRLDDDLLAEAKTYAAQHHTTLNSVMEEALRQMLATARQKREREPFRLHTFRGDGLQPGVNLDSNADLLAVMEEGLPLDKRR
jgi:plasmid stability protein